MPFHSCSTHVPCQLRPSDRNEHQVAVNAITCRLSPARAVRTPTQFQVAMACSAAQCLPLARELKFSPPLPSGRECASGCTFPSIPMALGTAAHQLMTWARRQAERWRQLAGALSRAGAPCREWLATFCLGRSRDARTVGITRLEGALRFPASPPRCNRTRRARDAR